MTYSLEAGSHAAEDAKCEAIKVLITLHQDLRAADLNNVERTCCPAPLVLIQEAPQQHTEFAGPVGIMSPPQFWSEAAPGRSPLPSTAAAPALSAREPWKKKGVFPAGP